MALYDAILNLMRDGEQLIKNLKSAPPADGTKPVLELIHQIQK